ncbi:hypothetical protein [Nocardioides sp. zg-DK7169]|uniref:hypothetical protein n=1 Tax=Nocardioides sp. zg-DK7169 TaxID=2736600 RepID=UPI00155180A1|nr:hypothetical protein [Nocardioides sp. zg-DK7169]NPC98314.1 hypothetical protein [Nocardioides sp. zg-DK7169]
MAHRHKRDTNARKPRAIVIAGPLAFLATASAVGLGVTVGEPESAEVISASSPSVSPAEATEDASPSAAAEPRKAAATPSTAASRGPVLSRSASRFELRELTPAEKMMAPAAVRTAIDQADTRLWATEDLNVWTLPGDQAQQVGTLEAGEKVLVTGRDLYGRDEVVVDGASRWVTSGYLSDEEPTPDLGGACTNGTSVGGGVSPNIVNVHAAVCAAFPQITSYGTLRSDGEHGQGLAIDIMVSGDLGWEIAEFIRANRVELGVSYLIYAQQIWSVERSGEGWRGMEDRGSVTANHYDHVHVTTY